MPKIRRTIYLDKETSAWVDAQPRGKLNLSEFVRESIREVMREQDAMREEMESKEEHQ